MLPKVIPFGVRNRGATAVYGRRSSLMSVFAMLLALGACALITHYDPTSYKNATDLKAEALLLIEKAKDPPGIHVAEIDSVQLKLRQAYEYERGKGSPNMLTVKQWELLINPQGNLLGGFLRKWKVEDKAQGETFIEEKAKQTGKAFDQIIELERAKVKN